MHAPPIRTRLEQDTRGCPVCGKPVDVSGLTGSCLMIDETGEFRYAHAMCGLNHHTETKKRLATVLCATCGLPLRDDHANYSGEVITFAMIQAAAPTPESIATLDGTERYAVGGYAVCRDGGLFVRGRDIEADVPAEHALPHEDAA